MRRKATDAQKVGARRETLDASEARRETRNIRRVSSLSSCNLVSRLTSHATAPWPKVRLGEEGGARRETIDASIASSLASKTARVSRLTSHAPWPTVLLGEVTIMKRGKYITRNDTSPGDVPVILGGQEPAYYCDKANHTGPCVVISRSGASAGFVSYWAQPIFVTDGFLFEANEQSNIRYVYYCLKANQSLLGNMQNGTGIPHVRGDDLKSFQIPLPPLPVQRWIADVLSAYDDLIENNRRRIAILEETARLAYRKWFGGSGAKGGMRHETLDASEVGRETRGVRRVSSLASHASVSRLTSHTQLRTVTLGEVVDVLYGKDHKKIPNGTIPIFGSGGVMRYGSNAIFDRPSVLIPRKGTISNVMYVDEPFWTVDTMFYTRMKIPYMEKIFYYQMCDLNLAAMSTGAAVPSMTTAILNSLQIVVPPENERKRFDESVEPLFGQMRLLKRQSAALVATRDMLLPRLMKGGTA